VDNKKSTANCFSLLAEFRRAETLSGVTRAFSVQKKFELRSTIMTSSNILKIQSRFVGLPNQL
jgi:hypothetical protein